MSARSAPPRNACCWGWLLCSTSVLSAVRVHAVAVLPSMTASCPHASSAIRMPCLCAQESDPKPPRQWGYPVRLASSPGRVSVAKRRTVAIPHMAVRLGDLSELQPNKRPQGSEAVSAAVGPVCHVSGVFRRQKWFILDCATVSLC